MVANKVDGITVLGTVQQAAWRRRELPPVERIGGGLWSVPVPIPDNPLRYTLSYLVPGDTGVVVVDPGWDTDEGWRALLAGLTTAGFAVGDVAGVVVTHVHLDHHGLSGKLRAESGAWIAMHPAEQATLPKRAAAHRPHPMLAQLRSGGIPEADLTEILGGREPSIPDLAAPDVLLEDGDFIPLPGRRLQAVWTPGHTPGHLCLREPDARLLLTGDHVLPRITPNIGMQPNGNDAPLRDFYASLEKAGAYDDHDALPAHEYRFHGLAARTRQLRDHHDARCQELVDVVGDLGRPTMWELAENLTWSRPWAEIGFMRLAALSETAAHASHLVDQGRLAWLADAEPVRLRVR